MALMIISGIPGSGKNLKCVYEAKKHFKIENSFTTKVIRKVSLYLYNGFVYLKNIIRKIFKKKPLYYRIDVYKQYIYDERNKINNVYSNFPIFLYSYYDKEDKIFKDVYSRSVSLWDLDNSYKFMPNSLIIIDEVQLYVDSDEFASKIIKDKFKPIGKFLQAHRHYGISNILVVSQHPDRVYKKIRNVTNEYLQVKFFRKIPLLPIGVMYAVMYYEQNAYGKSTTIDRKFRDYDFKTKLVICNIKKLYKSYDTCYLKKLNEYKPLKLDLFNEKYVSQEDIDVIFRDVE